MKKQVRKLTLSRETLRRLEDRTLRAGVGGWLPPPTGDDGTSCDNYTCDTCNTTCCSTNCASAAC